MPSWLKSLLTFAGIICVPLAIIALIGGLLAALGSKPQKLMHIRQLAVSTADTAPVQPAIIAPTPIATPAVSIQTPAPRAQFIGVQVPSAAPLFPLGRVPLERWIGDQWTVWQPGFHGYVLHVTPECVVSRASIISQPIAPRAQLVGLPGL
jgi:hypothetical protein